MNETGGLILGLAVAIAALSTVARLINVPYVMTQIERELDLEDSRLEI